jgi:beta-alanine--pyruvate transaminase
LIELHGAENIAACIVEPIAGSTGALVPPIGYLDRLREICTEHGVLLIFDEVICGFGRTGEAFAAQAFGVTPDIMTMAKAITNGVIPMGAVAVRTEIYETIVEEHRRRTIELFHGYTGSAHPVSCAASLATLDIYANEKLFQKAQALAPYFLARLFELESVPGVFDIRGFGMLGAVEIDPVRTGMTGYTLQKRLYDMGLHLKSTGNGVLVSPPFVCTHADIDRIVDTIRESLVRAA